MCDLHVIWYISEDFQYGMYIQYNQGEKARLLKQPISCRHPRCTHANQLFYAKVFWREQNPSKVQISQKQMAKKVLKSLSKHDKLSSVNRTLENNMKLTESKRSENVVNSKQLNCVAILDLVQCRL